jgi:hypothetical protein
MLADCHIVVDFEQFVQSSADVEALQRYLRRLHGEYCQGRIPKPIHGSEVEAYLRRELTPAANIPQGS